jgi:hypothetical protein
MLIKKIISSDIKKETIRPEIQVYMKSENGYVRVRDLSQFKQSKSWSVFMRNKGTQNFINQLSFNTRLPINELIIEKTTQKRWIHPHLALKYAAWISPILECEIYKLVYNYINPLKYNLIDFNDAHLRLKNLTLEKKELEEKYKKLDDKYISLLDEIISSDDKNTKLEEENTKLKEAYDALKKKFNEVVKIIT